MAKYQCEVCGYIYDEEKEGVPFLELKECPVCKQPVSKFHEMKEENSEAEISETSAESEKIEKEQSQEEQLMDLSYDSKYARQDASCRYMKEIHEMAVTGHSIHGAMGTQMPMPNWDDILLLGAQLNPPPLNDDEPVNITTVIGKNAKRPMILSGPVYVSHMSFGALSREIKTALAMGSAMAHTAM